jgi:hypothetical protein
MRAVVHVAVMVPVAIVAMLVPAPVDAWGFAAHRFITGRAVALLPAAIEPFFTARRDEILFRVVDPDLWRTVGWDEGPNHFLNFGVREYGDYPFTALPRDYGDAIERFGPATLDRNGRLPWRLTEMFDHLRRAFAMAATGRPRAADEVVLFAAAAAHYVQDASQPLHATANFDGHLTGQRGVHARFETDLFERFQQRVAVRPALVVPTSAPRDAAFELLLQSYQLADALLAADRAAAAEDPRYGDRYFDAFFVSAGPLLERRINDAITATASLIAGAWVAAGQPALGGAAPRPPDPLRRR